MRSHFRRLRQSTDRPCSSRLPIVPKEQLFQRSKYPDAHELHGFLFLRPDPAANESVALEAGADILWRQNTQDSFYQPPGVPLIPANANSERYLGEALILQLEWQPTPNLDVNVAVVHFFADGFLRAAGSQDIGWIGASATFNFRLMRATAAQLITSLK